MSIEKNVIQSLIEGEATFQYRKLDGTLRNARGTINETLIPSEKRAKSEVATDGPIQNYFDLEANDWRAFHTNMLVSTEA